MVKGIVATLLFGSAIVAHAQNSVTLYARLDTGLQYQTGLAKGNAFSVENAGWGVSWFGLKGVEDLGGGTKSIFDLQAGINPDNGTTTNGSFFGRSAIVGLENERWGTLDIGNIGAAEISGDAFFVDPQNFNAFANSTLIRGRNYAQAGNGMQYTSPMVGGLTVKGQYDLTNSTTFNSGNPGSGPGQLGGAQGRTDGIEVKYNSGNVQLQALYDEIRDPNGQFSNVYVASRAILAGGTWVIGPAKFFLAYEHLSAPNASDSGVFGSSAPTALPAGVSLPTAVDTEWAGVNWQINSVVGLNAAIYHANANNGNGNATLYTLVGTYNLSKHTFFYSELGYVSNSSTSNIGLGNGFSDPYGANVNNDPVNGSPANTNPNYGHGQASALVGIMTQF
jgi:predicted porin